MKLYHFHHVIGEICSRVFVRDDIRYLRLLDAQVRPANNSKIIAPPVAG